MIVSVHLADVGCCRPSAGILRELDPRRCPGMTYAEPAFAAAARRPGAPAAARPDRR